MKICFFILAVLMTPFLKGSDPVALDKLQQQFEYLESLRHKVWFEKETKEEKIEVLNEYFQGNKDYQAMIHAEFDTGHLTADHAASLSSKALTNLGFVLWTHSKSAKLALHAMNRAYLFTRGTSQGLNNRVFRTEMMPAEEAVTELKRILALRDTESKSGAKDEEYRAAADRLARHYGQRGNGKRQQEVLEDLFLMAAEMGDVQRIANNWGQYKKLAHGVKSNLSPGQKAHIRAIANSKGIAKADYLDQWRQQIVISKSMEDERLAENYLKYRDMSGSEIEALIAELDR